ncbi:hypothetical protein ZHAS_00017657 [Anopheles sinensis]|uniref:Uncharacterized protein n=1 Tax=Anopheles sinensis TaxID=74873 RepID=A0A084WHE5_ANOSI|nr:hypothetical protein ZHAS_00017657 [Anopheles sinensis]
MLKGALGQGTFCALTLCWRGRVGSDLPNTASSDRSTACVVSKSRTSRNRQQQHHTTRSAVAAVHACACQRHCRVCARLDRLTHRHPPSDHPTSVGCSGAAAGTCSDRITAPSLHLRSGRQRQRTTSRRTSESFPLASGPPHTPPSSRATHSLHISPGSGDHHGAAIVIEGARACGCQLLWPGDNVLQSSASTRV